MAFRDREKKRIISIKPNLFSSLAKPKGSYKKKTKYDFCLADGYSYENIHQTIRDSALKYFAARKIDWHDGIGIGPSNHLCCSQSACINFLFPFRDSQDNLLEVLKGLGYDAKEVLEIGPDMNRDKERSYVAFEWIGERNYLKETVRGRVATDSERTRGKNFTSADFAILFNQNDNRKHLILGEWKYTEEYKNKKSIRYSKSKSATDRLEKIYKPFLTSKNCPINVSALTDLDDLFYDPFDQLMRLQLLAKEMEISSPTELNADIVSVLHIAPDANKELMDYIPNPGLKKLGNNVHDIWMKLTESGKFKGRTVEDLTSIVTKNEITLDNNWKDYIKLRYDFK